LLVLGVSPAIALPHVVLEPYQFTYRVQSFCPSGATIRVHEVGRFGSASITTEHGEVIFREQEHIVGRVTNLATGAQATYMSEDQLWTRLPVGDLQVGDVLVFHYSGLNFIVRPDDGGVVKVSTGAAIDRSVVTAVDGLDAAWKTVVSVQTPMLVHASDELFPAIQTAVC